MAVVIVTGSAGLVGSACVRLFAERGLSVIGIDNDMRASFFGAEASTSGNLKELAQSVSDYAHHAFDIRDRDQVMKLFADHGSDIHCVIHTAAQPSHDWAARDPEMDFDINARATLTLLEATRQHCPKAAFVFTSTNKVYGDNPNFLPLVEQESRYEIASSHPFYAHGIDESMSTDHTTHSVFGVSKLAADAMVQEYGRYFGLNTACFRAGCITGGAHAGTQLHGFLAYVVKCAVSNTPYSVIGYKGKQVRDNIHAADLANMFWHFYQAPRPGEVYNAGGGRHVNCSVGEAIALTEKILGKSMRTHSVEEVRKGDHQWYISDTRRFEAHFPSWRREYDLSAILHELCSAAQRRA